MRHSRTWLFLALAGCSAAHEPTFDGDAAMRPVDAAVVAPADAGPPDSCAAPGGIGAPCATDAECTVHATFSPAFCVPAARGASSGYCSSVCMLDSDCGPCGRCVTNATGDAPVSSWYGLCVHACEPATACRAAYVCAAIDPSRSGCFPDCRSQPEICGSARCDPMTGSCHEGCAADADCSDGSHCAAGRCACGAATACGPTGACSASGTCGCATDAACGAGHACNAMIGCCAWGSGLCG